MPRFDASRFIPVSADGTDLDIVDATFKDIRFTIPTARVVEIDASTEANLPGIADRYLGDPALWWVLLDYNGLIDPINDIFPGQILRIPLRASLLAYLDRTMPAPSPIDTVVI